MKNDALLIVLTDNVWLHKGVAALLPGIPVQRMRFDLSLPPPVNYDQVIIVVDSLILFQGGAAFRGLMARWPSARIVWLIRKETGRIFPVRTAGDCILSQKQDIISLRHAIEIMLKGSQDCEVGEPVIPVNLTDMEHELLPYFMTRASLAEISMVTGQSKKTLCVYRRSITKKAGFRKMSFLQLVYERNGTLPGAYSGKLNFAT